MPREQEPPRPSTPAPRALVLAFLVVVVLPVLGFLVFLGSLPAPD